MTNLWTNCKGFYPLDYPQFKKGDRVKLYNEQFSEEVEDYKNFHILIDGIWKSVMNIKSYKLL